MDKLGRPRGLIRYSTQNRLERTGGGGVRFRVLVYPLLLAIVVAAFVGLLLTRGSAMVVQLRTQGTPYAVAADGSITNLLRLRIDNRSEEPRTYAIEGSEGVVLREPVSVTVEPSSSYEAELRIVSRPTDFERGRRTIELRVFDGRDYDQIHRFSIVGPFGDAREGRTPQP
jgi:polyferredoxin